MAAWDIKGRDALSNTAGPAFSGGAPITFGQDIDFSGFTVATGRALVTGGATNSKTSQPAMAAAAGWSPDGVAALAPAFGRVSLTTILLVGGGALLAYLALRQ